ncbi:hypothetical protein [Sediminicoccus sp. KRV36]|uniref:hypothetical protein n=1 Tax=Sediminicoccus sp. KRV36 TaxID=3133721 RepID=UPI00200BEABC|nr:hypothetical protein [Sediminicoccus rosea]UPY36189.1 hypothetical protein LHU95_18515 [Sediminicoccus rosea]
MNQMTDAVENTAHDAVAEIAKLRQQVEALMNERVTPLLGSVATSAENAAKLASDEVRHQAARLTDAVQEKPLVALGLAALAGFVLASVLRR